MTIRIVGDHGVGPVNGPKKAKKKQSSKGTDKLQGIDRVEFSAMLQEVSRAIETNSVDDPEWSEKVRILKEQIASGNYQPDLHKVAASLLRYLLAGR